MDWGSPPPHQHCYGQLLSICLMLLVTFTLPQPWNRLSSLGGVAPSP